MHQVTKLECSQTLSQRDLDAIADAIADAIHRAVRRHSYFHLHRRADNIFFETYIVLSASLSN